MTYAISKLSLLPYHFPDKTEKDVKLQVLHTKGNSSRDFTTKPFRMKSSLKGKNLLFKKQILSLES